MPELTPLQAEAFDHLSAFMKDPKRDKFGLTGLAGTGKTTLAAHAVAEFGLIPCAFTARAAFNLADKCCVDPHTIHNLIYFPNEIQTPIYDKAGNVIRYEYDVEYIYREDAHYHGQAFLVDECSMIGQSLGEDLYRTGAKLIAVGDHGQLQPVNDKRYFNHADFELTEILRQAKESPIIRQAHRIRQVGAYKDDTDDFKVVHKVTDAMLMDADVRIVWKNDTRISYNNRIRQINGLNGNPKAGEPVMCLVNCHAHGVYNGVIYTLMKDFDPMNDKAIVIDLEGEATTIQRVDFCHDRKEMKRGSSTCFDFGYVMTCHKAQGSEWDKVLVIDEYPTYFTDRRSWLYTAVTRARQSILIKR